MGKKYIAALEQILPFLLPRLIHSVNKLLEEGSTKKYLNSQTLILFIIPKN